MMKNEKRNMGTGGLPVAFDLALKGRACSLHQKGRPEFGWKGLSGSVEVNRRLVMLSDAKAAPVCTFKAGKHPRRIKDHDGKRIY